MFFTVNEKFDKTSVHVLPRRVTFPICARFTRISESLRSKRQTEKESLEHRRLSKEILEKRIQGSEVVADRTQLTFFKGTFVFFENPLTCCFQPPPASLGLPLWALINSRYESGVATFLNVQRASLSLNEFPR